MSKPTPGYYILSESWYARTAMASQKQEDPSFVDEIMVGLYYGEDGGCYGEFGIRFKRLGRYGVYPRLEAYSDSWDVIEKMADFMKELAKIDRARKESEGNPPSKEQIIELMKKLGFKDLTKRTGSRG